MRYNNENKIYPQVLGKKKAYVLSTIINYYSLQWRNVKLKRIVYSVEQFL